MGIFRPHSSIMLRLKFKIVGTYLLILWPKIPNSMSFFSKMCQFWSCIDPNTEYQKSAQDIRL